MSDSIDRRNPWVSIPAAVYEGHMGSPRVLQLQFLSAVFRELLDRHRPASVAVLGCATGNGLEHIDPRRTTSVVGIDINPEYMAILMRRHSGRLPGLRAVLGDIAACELEPGSMDLVHCALVFEYVDPRAVLGKTAMWLPEGGVMSVVLQLPSAGHEKVADTEYKNVLSRLEPIMELIDPAEFAKLSEGAGFVPGPAEVRTLETGKKFHVGEYVRKRRS
jgi:SAM-dependent methyltransferase